MLFTFLFIFSLYLILITTNKPITGSVQQAHIDLNSTTNSSICVFFECERESDQRSTTMGGGMEANKNKFIEDWGTVRENLEHNFRWTRRNLAIVGIFGVAIPYLVYKGTVREFHMQDEDNNRPYRKFLP
ncbi:putative NADH:ubiquinone reductase (H(+)-translocating) [Helianthus annuus]|nr:putative NADH:ubiquinone reductase (H(+)-translocating) [Helianthus annuus]KAJ0934105.1 putative NADH:ubiquinone reductase (H(+)-translocating) [Helianthus annuus]